MARKNDADAALANSIWINKKEDDLKTVDLKKLERASELQLKKQDRKDGDGGGGGKSKYKSSEATASQVINKAYEDVNARYEAPPNKYPI